MEIAIAGAGYVGLTSAACFCEMGHRVGLVEIDPRRLDLIRQGGCPIYEPDLPEMLKRHIGRTLHVTGQMAEALERAQVLFVCVGTPPRHNGSPDLSAVRHLLQGLRKLPALAGKMVVLKSTVPPGTCRMASELLDGRTAVVSNPEFLREGTAIHDFFHPDRIVVGGPDEQANLRIAGLYQGISAPLVLTGWEESELVKYATNSFLAVKISFANEIAAVCDQLGIEAGDVLQGLGADHRVGPQFLRPGPGYGGSCLPKDVKALIWKARRAGVHLDLLPAAERVNAKQRLRLTAALEDLLGDLSGKVVAVWGLAFKAGTDDLRGAAAIEIIPRLLTQGARVRAYDPAANEGFARLFPPERWPGLSLTRSPAEAVQGADGLLILTEWEEFRSACPAEIARLMAGRSVVDGRNLLDPERAVQAGLHYRGVGRGRAR